MTWPEHLFQIFWQPEVMMILMLIVIYGFIAEISHPGAILPGVAGAMALILLLYMSAIAAAEHCRRRAAAPGRRAVRH